MYSLGLFSFARLGQERGGGFNCGGEAVVVAFIDSRLHAGISCYPELMTLA